MIVDEEEFLDHHGIKGMKWGVRKEGSSGKTDHSKRNKRIAIGVGVVGAAAATALLARHGHLKMSQAKAQTKHIQETQKLLAARKLETREFLQKVNARQRAINLGANDDLKKLYTLNDTPIRLREYLPTL